MTGEWGAAAADLGIEPSTCPRPDTADGSLAAGTIGIGILGADTGALVALVPVTFRAPCSILLLSGREGGAIVGEGGGAIKGVLGITTFGITGTGGCNIFSTVGLGHESSEDTADRMVGILDEADLGGGLGMLISGTDIRRGLMLSWEGGPRPKT